MLANQLTETRNFYRDTLNLPILRDDTNSVTVGCGQTEIKFVETTSEIPRVAYHFAFNIPENKLEQARAWIASGVQLVGGCCGLGPTHIQALKEGLAL